MKRLRRGSVLRTGATRVIHSLLGAAAFAVCGCQQQATPVWLLRQTAERVDQRVPTHFDIEALGPREPAEAPPGEELTLADAIARALRHNYSLAASAEGLAIAQANLVQAGLLQNPVLGQSSGILAPVSPVAGGVSADVNLSQQINTFITRQNRIAAADVQRAEAALDVAAQAFELALQVRTKYAEIAHQTRRAELASRIGDLYGRALRAAEARARVGVVPMPEVNRARLQAADAERETRRVRFQTKKAASDLNWLMGESGAVAWHLPPPALEVPSALAPLPTPDRAAAAARNWRLDLERAELDQRYAETQIRLAEQGRFPPFTVGPFELARDNAGAWTLGPFFSLTLPIFDTGETAVMLAKAQLRKAEKTHMALAGQIQSDVSTALAAAELAEADVRFYRDQYIPQQEENIRLAQQAFELGKLDLDSLLNTLRDYVSGQQAYEDTLGAYNEALVALERALGITLERLATSAPEGTASQPASAPETQPSTP